jgi:hypothetical protein
MGKRRGRKGAGANGLINQALKRNPGMTGLFKAVITGAVPTAN